ncbi:MAG: hypothetical protein AAFS11_07975, partial [Planctomycetota bacterium]
MIVWILPWVLVWSMTEVRFALEATPDTTVDYGAQLRELAIRQQVGASDHSESFEAALSDHAQAWKSVLTQLSQAHLTEAEYWPDVGLVYAESDWTGELDEHPVDRTLSIDQQLSALAAIRDRQIEWLDSWDELGLWADLDTLNTGAGYVVFDLPDPLDRVLIT